MFIARCSLFTFATVVLFSTLWVIPVNGDYVTVSQALGLCGAQLGAAFNIMLRG